MVLQWERTMDVQIYAYVNLHVGYILMLINMLHTNVN